MGSKGPEYLRNLLSWFKENPEFTSVKDFFIRALEPYYISCIQGGMKTELGHIIYRLSDRIDKERREQIIVYSPNGTNLEQWREDWETQSDNIPDFSMLDLPEHMY